MQYFYPLILSVHILVGITVVGLVLLQHGKGADMGAGFGGGASASLFGASGSANFLSRTTAVLATVFFITSMSLAYLANTAPRLSGSVVDSALPASPATATTNKETPAAAAPVPLAPANTTADDSKAKEIPR